MQSIGHRVDSAELLRAAERLAAFAARHPLRFAPHNPAIDAPHIGMSDAWLARIAMDHLANYVYDCDSMATTPRECRVYRLALAVFRRALRDPWPDWLHIEHVSTVRQSRGMHL